MATKNTTNGSWLWRQWNKLPMVVQLGVIAYCLLDWRAIREHGLVFGLKSSFIEFARTVPFMLFVVVCAIAIAWLNARAKTLDPRRVGLKAGLFFGRLGHERISNEGS